MDSVTSAHADLGGDELCFTGDDQCPLGEKCIVLEPLIEPDVFSSQVCRPLVNEPGSRGDECTSVSGGGDTCDRGLLCHAGRCVTLCVGKKSDPLELVCTLDWAICKLWGDASYGLCTEVCDPLDSKCADGDECTQGGSLFSCAADSDPDLPLFESCKLHSDCQEGLACIPNAASECFSNSSCCTPICDVEAENVGPPANLWAA